MLSIKLSDHAIAAISALIIGGFAASAQAALTNLFDTTITTVSVNGGADSVSPGTSCIQLAIAVPAACNGWVAIPNNNKQLIAAALTSKTTGTKINLYYETAAGSNHCPGYVFTPCSVISIVMR